MNEIRTPSATFEIANLAVSKRSSLSHFPSIFNASQNWSKAVIIWINNDQYVLYRSPHATFANWLLSRHKEGFENKYPLAVKRDPSNPKDSIFSNNKELEITIEIFEKSKKIVITNNTDQDLKINKMSFLFR